MTSDSFSLPPSDEALEALVNDVIDAESQGDDALALVLIRRGVAEFPGFGSRLAATRAAVKALRRPVFVPDQRAEVLLEADFVRPFLSPRVRRQISASRVAVAAGLVLTASLLTTLKYVYPDLEPAGQNPGVVGAVVEASRADASASIESLASVVQELRSGMQAPVESVLRTGSPNHRLAIEPLSLGRSRDYDPDLSLGPLSPADGPRTVAWRRRDTERSVPSSILASSHHSAPGPFPLISDRPLRLLGGEVHRSAAVRPVNLWDQLKIDDDGVVTFGDGHAKPPVQPAEKALQK